MHLVRRHLRRGVVAWLACHVLSFTALVPRDCCAAHAHAGGPATNAAHHEAAAPASEHALPCHEMATETPATASAAIPVDHCDMPTSDGAACPMHRAGAVPADCSMTGVCHAPEAALAAVLWQAAVPSVVPATFTPAAALVPSLALVAPSIALAVPPDSPPPRS